MFVAISAIVLKCNSADVSDDALIICVYLDTCKEDATITF